MMLESNIEKKPYPDITVDDVEETLRADGWDLDTNLIYVHYASEILAGSSYHDRTPILTLFGGDRFLYTNKAVMNRLGYKVDYFITGAKHFAIVGRVDDA